MKQLPLTTFKLVKNGERSEIYKSINYGNDSKTIIL